MKEFFQKSATQKPHLCFRPAGPPAGPRRAGPTARRANPVEGSHPGGPAGLRRTLPNTAAKLAVQDSACRRNSAQDPPRDPRGCGGDAARRPHPRHPGLSRAPLSQRPSTAAPRVRHQVWMGSPGDGKGDGPGRYVQEVDPHARSARAARAPARSPSITRQALEHSGGV